MKKLLLEILMFFPIVAGMMLVNYAGDPACLFQNREMEKGMAHALLSGQNITDLKHVNFDERILQEYYIAGMTKPREVVILGSSHTMAIHAEHFPGRTFINNSVSGGTLQDYIAIYGLYREKGLLPSTVVLVIDPWVFNRFNDLYYWQSLMDSYNKMTAWMSRRLMRIPYRLIHFMPRKYLEIVSPSYFQFSLLQGKKYGWDFLKKTPSTMYRITSDRINDETTLLADGSRIWEKEIRRLASIGITKDLPTFGDPAWRLANFRSLDDEYIQMFADFVKLMKRDKVNVVFLMPPFHPQAYDALAYDQEYDAAMHKTEDFLKKIGKEEGIKVIGSFSPYIFGLKDGMGFHDRYHFNEKVVQRIFDQYDLNNNLYTKPQN